MLCLAVGEFPCCPLLILWLLSNVHLDAWHNIGVSALTGDITALLIGDRVASEIKSECNRVSEYCAKRDLDGLLAFSRLQCSQKRTVYRLEVSSECRRMMLSNETLFITRTGYGILGVRRRVAQIY